MIKKVLLLVSTIAVVTLIFLLLPERKIEKDPPEKDSVTTIIQNEYSQFDNIDSIMAFKDRFTKMEINKLIFLDLSPQMVERVSKVVLKDNKKATLESIVNEYRKNYEVYSSLVDPDESLPLNPDDYNIVKNDTNISGQWE